MSNLIEYKFDDCSMCRFRKKPATCADCGAGELFEERGRRPLDFNTNTYIYVRSGEDTRSISQSQALDRLNDLNDELMDD